MSTYSEILDNDIVILVMGITGTGKSALIDHLAPGQRAGDGLTSYTKDVEMVVVEKHFSKRIILIDTPGFDGTEKTDMEVLEEISNFLAALYRNKILLHGVIYTQSITDNRMSESQCHALRCFRRLCGDHTCPNILFVTTMWDAETERKRAEEMQRQLREKYWRNMISFGASTTPYWNTPLSAWETMKNFIGRSQGLPHITLQIQDDIVNKRLSLGETEAARALQPAKVVILLLGLRGAGKSTFVNAATEFLRAGVHRDPTSTTSLRVETFQVDHPQKLMTLIFVDPPGLDHTSASDSEVLKKIGESLGALNNSTPDALFGGVIYLHDISESRTQSTIGTTVLTLLSVPEPSKHVLLATTKWKKAMTDPEENNSRHSELVNGAWKQIRERGALVGNFEDPENSESAWSLVDLLLDRQPLDLQFAYSEINALQEKLRTLGPSKVQRKFLTPKLSKVQQRFLTPKLSKVEQKPPTPGACQPPKVVILLLGLTGAGKSTFVNTAMKSSRTRVDQNLTSTNLQVETFQVDHPHKSTTLIFVDPPGFDHTNMDDAAILKKISESLGALNNSTPDALFGGVIYLHDISESRMHSTIGMTILMLLSVPEPSKHILLATTKWKKAMTVPEELNARHSELVDGAWRRITQRGALVGKFEDAENSESAWKLVDILLERPPLGINVACKEIDILQRRLPIWAQKRTGFFV